MPFSEQSNAAKLIGMPEQPYGELTSLPTPESEDVTSLTLQNLLVDLKAKQSNSSADMFFKNRREVLQPSILELPEAVVSYKDHLEVTL